MRYHAHFRSLRWHHWEDLWRNNLPDLNSTKEIAPTTIFVAVDTEPWTDRTGNKIDDTAPCEIGITLLLPSTDYTEQPSASPRTLEEVGQRFPISSHCISIRGRERRSFGERFWNGGPQGTTFVEPEGVEDTIIHIVRTVQQQARSSHGKHLPLTLVGFDLGSELRTFSHLYPRFLSCFTSWVDIQELARDITPPDTKAPSLRNTLLAFGYEPKFPTRPTHKRGHSAGNDAMRSISVLVTLLFYSPRGEDLVQACLDYHANRGKMRAKKQREKLGMVKRDLFAKGCPRPRQKYPFLAKVDLVGSITINRLDPGVLCEYFLKYKPIAAGASRFNVFGGWICLASVEALELFVKEVDGLADAEGRGTWTAESGYNPKAVPAVTKAELDEYMQQRSVKEIAEKKRARQEKKEAAEQSNGLF